MDAISFYSHAKEVVSNSVYSAEIEWQQSLDFANVSETDLLRESAWVILNSGFRESVIRKHFSAISLAFGDWESAQFIVQNKKLCKQCALEAFANTRKISAIIKIAEIINAHGAVSYLHQVMHNPIEELSALPFIGKTTVWHLAKNLGCNVAKPDRHLVRVAEKFEFDCVQEFCRYLARHTGEKVSVIDIVIWRYCASFRADS